MRSAEFADAFERTQDDFIQLVESLSDEQWKLMGKNFPQRLNDEDEDRPVGVIAHHVAVSGPRIMDRIEKGLRGEAPPPPPGAAQNARHAEEHADCTRDEVLQMLREAKPGIADAVRAIPDDKMDLEVQTAIGPMTISQRLERVLIGHIKSHQGSIEAAIAR